MSFRGRVYREPLTTPVSANSLIIILHFFSFTSFARSRVFFPRVSVFMLASGQLIASPRYTICSPATSNYPIVYYNVIRRYTCPEIGSLFRGQQLQLQQQLRDVRVAAMHRAMRCTIAAGRFGSFESSSGKLTRRRASPEMMAMFSHPIAISNRWITTKRVATTGRL